MADKKKKSTSPVISKPLTSDSTSFPRWGALDNDEHFWLPPPHVRLDLRQSLPSANWNGTVLLLHLIQLAVVLIELVVTITEIYSLPSSPQQKFATGVLLLGAETLGSIICLALGLEMWFWSLGFGWSWWGGNVVEVMAWGADVVVRLWYTGSVPLARCSHLIVRPKGDGTDA
jgi:hypothetical protein